MYILKLLAWQTYLEAYRNHFFSTYIIILLIIMMIARFIGHLTLLEHTHFQLAFIGFSIRLISVLLVCVFITSSLIREQTDKVIELHLALPITRSQYFLGKLAGYMAICLTVSLMNIGLFLLYWDVQSPIMPIFAWSGALTLELLVICACCLFMTFTCHQALPAIGGTLLFYCMARSINSIKTLSDVTQGIETSFLQDLLHFIILCLHWVFPRLDQLVHSSWLTFGAGMPEHWLAYCIETITFIGIISGAALWDLSRKQL